MGMLSGSPSRLAQPAAGVFDGDAGSDGSEVIDPDVHGLEGVRRDSESSVEEALKLTIPMGGVVCSPMSEDNDHLHDFPIDREKPGNGSDIDEVGSETASEKRATPGETVKSAATSEADDTEFPGTAGSKKKKKGSRKR